MLAFQKIVILCLACWWLVTTAVCGEFSGELSFETRGYFHEGAHENSDRVDLSIILQPEYVIAWDEDRKVFTFEPFVRYSSLDKERSHVDIRELSFLGSWELIELRVGISKVFWGVTESQHLVDVINQTDLVESPDGEDKLGQPMINIAYVNEFGNFEIFLLPYFRERTFSGIDGRFRGSPVVNMETASYLSGSGNNHLDAAFRWSHYIDELDWALSYFEGTDREPRLYKNADGTALEPVYGLARQASLEVQYTISDWLLKAEVLSRHSDLHGNYWASVTGFEYTFANVHRGMDVGFLYEYLYDDRKELAGSGLDNATFLGSRVALNDENGFELLVGSIIDHQTGRMNNAFLESTRRINENWKWTLESNFLVSPRSGSFLEQVKRDDYLQASLSFFW